MQTPLGNLSFGCEINGKICNTAPSSVISVNKNISISSWHSEHYALEFLRFKMNPILPVGMIVDDCICGVWRIKAFRELKVSFSCSLNTALMGTPDSGEGLIAETFEDENYLLSIGSEDEDYLQSRAGSEWFPGRLQSEIDSNLLEYLPNGIKLSLPYLLIQEQVQIHFIVSLSSKINSENSTWFAVDQSLKEAMNQMNIK